MAGPAIPAPTTRARPHALVTVATLGSVAIAASSWAVGAVPVAWRNEVGAPAWVLYYGGLVAVCVTWLLLGRQVRADAVGPSTVRRYALLAGAPLLAAAPMGRDLWAYAAQGLVTRRGLDPYVVGPSAVPGPFADEVSRRWVMDSAPYGPAWLRISELGQWLSADHPVVAVLLLRLPAFAGLALSCWAVSRLATRWGAPAGTALWLGPACPLMLVLGVGGGHNDLLAIGLALAGLAVASGPGLRSLALGAALAAAAVMVKSPALIPLAFTAPLWLAANPAAGQPVRRVATACATAAATGLAVLAAVTVATGLGTGWTRQVDADASWTSVLSLPTAVGMLGRLLSGETPVRQVAGLVHDTRTVGEVLAVLIVAALWAVAVRRAVTAPGTAPFGLLAGALAAAVLLAPSVQAWYYLWTIVPAALVVRRHASFVGLATLALLFPIMIMPSGTGWESDLRFPLVVALALGVVAWTFRRGPVSGPSARTARRSAPERARSGTAYAEPG